MATPDPELRAYDELIGSLEEKLGGLSAVHQGLGEAARSLVGAHRELDDAKRSIDALAASTEGMLDEVRRLQPAELAATLDASLAGLSRETSEGQGALGERLLTLAGEEAASREQADAQFATLTQRLAEHEETLTTRLSVTQEVLAASSDATRRAVTEAVAEAHRATQSALVVLRDRQEMLRQTLEELHRQQGNHSRQLDAIRPLLTQLQHHQAQLAQQLTSVTEATTGIRGVADTTQSTALAHLRVSERLAPTLSSALERARNDLAAESARTRRLHLLSFLVLLTAIALAWAALAGFIPNP